MQLFALSFTLTDWLKYFSDFFAHSISNSGLLNTIIYVRVFFFWKMLKLNEIANWKWYNVAHKYLYVSIQGEVGGFYIVKKNDYNRCFAWYTYNMYTRKTA